MLPLIFSILSQSENAQRAVGTTMIYGGFLFSFFLYRRWQWRIRFLTLAMLILFGGAGLLAFYLSQFG